MTKPRTHPSSPRKQASNPLLRVRRSTSLNPLPRLRLRSSSTTLSPLSSSSPKLLLFSTTPPWCSLLLQAPALLPTPSSPSSTPLSSSTKPTLPLLTIKPATLTSVVSPPISTPLPLPLSPLLSPLSIKTHNTILILSFLRFFIRFCSSSLLQAHQPAAAVRYHIWHHIRHHAPFNHRCQFPPRPAQHLRRRCNHPICRHHQGQPRPVLIHHGRSGSRNFHLHRWY